MVEHFGNIIHRGRRQTRLLEPSQPVIDVIGRERGRLLNPQFGLPGTAIVVGLKAFILAKIRYTKSPA